MASNEPFKGAHGCKHRFYSRKLLLVPLLHDLGSQMKEYKVLCINPSHKGKLGHHLSSLREFTAKEPFPWGFTVVIPL